MDTSEGNAGVQPSASKAAPLSLFCPVCGEDLLYSGLTASGLYKFTCPRFGYVFVVEDGLLCGTSHNGKTFYPGVGTPLHEVTR